MIADIEKYVSIYHEKLLAQKNLYENILFISHEEELLLKTKPLRLNKVIELLHQKNELLNSIHQIESEIIPIREKLNDLPLADTWKDSITVLIQQIGRLLEQLINTDAGNEQLLQDTMNYETPKPINTTYAVNAYKTCSR
ncbi:MAG: hypothetical protein RBU23_10370 [Candidatus Auribacterota bacterium]|nr:hypothetical protein [Candidatus Auribacterota bacterium]